MSKQSSSQILTARRLAGAAGLLVMAGTAGAGDIFDVSTSGSDIGYWVVEDPATDPCTVAFASSAPVDPVLSGILQNATGTSCSGPSALGPGGYIELGATEATVWSSGVKTLTGNLPAGAADFEITLSSLLESDWSNLVNGGGLIDPTGLPLVQQYIRDVIAFNCNGYVYPIPPAIPPMGFPTLAQLGTCFLSGTLADCFGTAISPPPAQKASNPDITYVQLDELTAGRPITIGLTGLTNSTGFLPPTFVCPNAPTTPLPSLVLTEVVKVTTTCDGQASPTIQYRYGFTPRYVSGMSGVSGYEQVYPVSPTGLETCYTDPVPALVLVSKTAAPTTYTAAGQDITYTYRLQNTGNVTLQDFSIADNRVPSGIVCPQTSLAVGATMNCTGTYEITPADVTQRSVTNLASATARPFWDNQQHDAIQSNSVSATVRYVRPPPTGVPALGLLGQIILGLLILISAGWHVRKRRR